MAIIVLSSCAHCSIYAIFTLKKQIPSLLILMLSLDQLQAFIYMAFQDIFAPSSIYPPCFLYIFKVGRNGVLKCMRNRKCGLQLEEGVGAKVIVSNGNKSVVGNHSPAHKFDWYRSCLDASATSISNIKTSVISYAYCA